MRIEAGQFGGILKSAAELIGALGYDKNTLKLERWGESENGNLELILHINGVDEAFTLTLPKPLPSK